MLQSKNVKLYSDVDLDIIVAKTRGYSGAEVVAVYQNAALIALRENEDAEYLKMDHFLLVVFKTDRCSFGTIILLVILNNNSSFTENHWKKLSHALKSGCWNCMMHSKKDTRFRSSSFLDEESTCLRFFMLLLIDVS